MGSPPGARAEVTPLEKALLIGCARLWAATATSGTRGGVCGLGRPSAAPSQVDGRSWERHFQRRDAKCITLCISEVTSTSPFAFQRHSLHFTGLRFARDLLMRVHPRGTSAASGLEITAELIVVDRIAIGRCGTVPASSFFGTRPVVRFYA